MGKSAGRPPPAPDPVALANAQADANTRTAQEQQRLNMISTSGPSGTVRYVADPTAPGGYRQETTLSAGEQQAYDQGLNVYNRALGTAGDQIGRVNDALSRGLNTEGLPELQGYDSNNFDRQRFEDAVYQSQVRRLDPQWQRAESSQDARLAAQGLGANSEATRNLRQDFARDRNDAYANAANLAIQAGGDEQSRAIQQQLAGSTFNNQARTQGLQERAYQQNIPLQQLQALLGTGSVSMPQGIQYSPTAIGQTDVLGANALSLNQQNQNYQARMQQRQAGLQGLFQLGSAAMTAFSDVRLKENIERVGEYGPIGVYEFNYLWSPERVRGLMAQEVLEHIPHAVTAHESGYLMVNYGMV